MKLEFRKSFIRDLKRVKDRATKNRVREAIQSVERAKNLREIKDLKKLSYRGRYYRIRIGDYRLGLILEDDTLILIRFLHRKDLYRYFP
ncbi:MAG: type II toxin-antitoxin system RelE/ParE family toxin [Desulfobacteraceae bacterium]|nr:type II toxin-antitoxin system RelE/ParE family toxin [Desulfobacteraceae bacterium]